MCWTHIRCNKRQGRQPMASWPRVSNPSQLTKSWGNELKSRDSAKQKRGKQLWPFYPVPTSQEAQQTCRSQGLRLRADSSINNPSPCFVSSFFDIAQTLTKLLSDLTCLICLWFRASVTWGGVLWWSKSGLVLAQFHLLEWLCSWLNHLVTNVSALCSLLLDLFLPVSPLSSLIWLFCFQLNPLHFPTHLQ